MMESSNTPTSPFTPASPARAANPAVADALELIIAEATKMVAAEIEPAMDEVTESQEGLAAQLRLLDDEMASITSVLETVKLDPETSARMEETKEVLRRTKRKLTTIRGRLGRLRMYEESDRLHLTETQLIDVAAAGRGTEPAHVHISTDDLWDAQSARMPEEVQQDEMVE